MMNSLGIYFHVPFCAKKCPYCDFYSGSFTKKAAEDYTAAVIRNIRHYSQPGTDVDTVYFGGGTPSLLTAGQLSDITEAVRSHFLLSPEAEITLEANPSTLTPEKLAAFRKAGINRLSIGVQSMVPEELSFLGRSHTPERAEKAVLDAHAAGFENISCDLMIALPGQTAESLAASVNALAELPIKHISAYILKVEDGTPFAERDVQSILPDEDGTAALYLGAVRLLAEKGFMQYEVSNFAVPGYESRHNCRYWLCQDYLGIGPAAHSCFGGKRFCVPSDTADFISAEHQHTEVTDDEPCRFEEKAMLRLRLAKGLDLRDVPEHRRDIEKKIPALLSAGYIRFDGNVISLTPEGFLVSNSVISSLIFS